MDMPQRQPRRLNRLRLLWTGGSALLLFSLCVFWLRGHSRIDTGGFALGPYLFTYATGFGEAAIEVSRPVYLRSELAWRGGWHRTIQNRNSWHPDGKGSWYSVLGFGLQSYLLRGNQPETILKFAVPYWSIVLIAIGIVSLRWIPWSVRFSLRTLLIATTIVSVGLGICCMS